MSLLYINGINIRTGECNLGIILEKAHCKGVDEQLHSATGVNAEQSVTDSEGGNRGTLLFTLIYSKR